MSPNIVRNIRNIQRLLIVIAILFYNEVFGNYLQLSILTDILVNIKSYSCYDEIEYRIYDGSGLSIIVQYLDIRDRFPDYGRTIFQASEYWIMEMSASKTYHLLKNMRYYDLILDIRRLTRDIYFAISSARLSYIKIVYFEILTSYIGEICNLRI